jgi:hypothetical protein
MHTGIKPCTSDTKSNLSCASPGAVHRKTCKKSAVLHNPNWWGPFQVLSSFTDDNEAQSLLCITEAIFAMFVSFLLSPFEHGSSITWQNKKTRHTLHAPETHMRLRSRYRPSDCGDINCSYLCASESAVTIRGAEPPHARVRSNVHLNITISAGRMEVLGTDLMYHFFPFVFYFFITCSCLLSFSLFSEMFLFLLFGSYASQFSF